jgi:molecular chaperone DnaK
MQEPVAAVMSVMRQRKNDGVFVVYDLGGGTLDIAIAESIAGRVNLLAHGGIAMCGGRDFDRILFDNVVKPWLLGQLRSARRLDANPQFKSCCGWRRGRRRRPRSSCRRRKRRSSAFPKPSWVSAIRLVKRSTSTSPLIAKRYDELIASKVEESIQSARETLEKAG